MSAYAERALLGALLFAPRLIRLCDDLAPSDFSSPARTAIYSELVDACEEAAPVDCVLIEARLLDGGYTPPAGLRHWFTALARLVDEAILYGAVDEDVVPVYVAMVRDAAVCRQLARIGTP